MLPSMVQANYGPGPGFELTVCILNVSLSKVMAFQRREGSVVCLSSHVTQWAKRDWDLGSMAYPNVLP